MNSSFSPQVRNFNYPEELRHLTFRWDYMVKVW